MPAPERPTTATHAVQANPGLGEKGRVRERERERDRQALPSKIGAATLTLRFLVLLPLFLEPEMPWKEHEKIYRRHL